MTIEDIDNQVANDPLSKKELKKQFVEKTNELGLKHAFTFEEAWEVGQELRRKQEFREKMTDLHEEIAQGGGLVGKDAEELLIITKIHKKEHPFFLMKGKMSILTEDGVKTIEAPHHGVTQPGTKRAIYAHEDCVFITVHATDKTTPEEVEEEVIAKDFNDSDISLENSINELNEIIGLDE